jgi:hypothetical protein
LGFRRRRRRRRKVYSKGFFWSGATVLSSEIKADAVNEEDPERDRATQV